MFVYICWIKPHRAMISKSGHVCGGSDNDIQKASGPRRNVQAKSFRPPQKCPVWFLFIWEFKKGEVNKNQSGHSCGGPKAFCLDISAGTTSFLDVISKPPQTCPDFSKYKEIMARCLGEMCHTLGMCLCLCMCLYLCLSFYIYKAACMYVSISVCSRGTNTHTCEGGWTDRSQYF